METAVREPYGPAAERRAAGRLAGRAAGGGASALAGLADEVLAVATLLGREPRLRRALVDPARSADDRVELVRGLLRGKVGAEALRLVEELVSARWPGPGDLRDAAERLGADTVLAGADRADELGEVEDELFRFAQVVDGAPRLAALL